MEHFSKKLNWHHAAMQGAFWAGFNALWGYISVFLLFKGFSNGQIGLISSLALVLPTVIQPALASLSDHSIRFNSRRVAAILVCVTLGITAVLRTLGNTRWVTAVCFVLIGTLLQLIAPYFNAIVMEYHLRGIPVNYGFGRGFGSACYAAMSMGLGFVLEKRSPAVILPIFAVSFALLLLIIIAFRYPLPPLPEAAEKKPEDCLSNGQILQNYPTFVLLLIGSALVMASHNTINTYFIHIVGNIGKGETLMGILMAISAFMELPSMTLFPYFSSRFSITTLLRLATFGFLGKALLFAFGHSPVFLYLAALLQFFEFGILQPAMVYYTARLLSVSNLVKGQSLFHLFSNCIGPAAASLICGFLLDHFGVSAMMLFLVSCCVAGLIIIHIATRRKNHSEVTV